MLKKKKNNKGFTLVELLVVIAIIGILAVVAVPSLLKNVNKAKAAKIVADFSSIKSEVMAEYADGELVTTTTVSALEVQDLSLPVGNYTLVYQSDVNNNIIGVRLVIDTENDDIADRVIEEMSETVGAIKGNVTAIASNGTLTNDETKTDTVTLQIIK